MEDTDFIQILKKHSPPLEEIEHPKIRWTLPYVPVKVPDIESLFTEPEPKPVKTRKEIRTNEKKQVEQLRKEIRELKKSIPLPVTKIIREKKTDDVQLSALIEEVTRLQEMVRRQGLYEYGSSLNVLEGGTPVGFTGAINFKNGTNTTVKSTLNQAGYIDVEIDATSAAPTFYNDTVSGTIDGTNKVFTVPNTIVSALFLSLGNTNYQAGVDYTVTGAKQITMTVAPDATLSGQPFWLSHT